MEQRYYLWYWGINKDWAKSCARERNGIDGGFKDINKAFQWASTCIMDDVWYIVDVEKPTHIPEKIKV